MAVRRTQAAAVATLAALGGCGGGHSGPPTRPPAAKVCEQAQRAVARRPALPFYSVQGGQQRLALSTAYRGLARELAPGAVRRDFVVLAERLYALGKLQQGPTPEGVRQLHADDPRLLARLRRDALAAGLPACAPSARLRAQLRVPKVPRRG